MDRFRAIEQSSFGLRRIPGEAGGIETADE
jgi:hypothetical protein